MGCFAILTVTRMLTTMRPVVRILCPDGVVAELGHGDIIGRLDSAALRISDPRVSEAHAMVSLRGTTLKLLALRGRFTVDGKVLSGVELEPGMVITVAQRLSLRVIDVVLPERVTAIRLGNTQLRVLTGVVSLITEPKPQLRAGYHRAAAHFWALDDTVWLGQPDTADRALLSGESFSVGELQLQLVSMTLGADGDYVTTARGAVASPLELVTRFESVHVYRDAQPCLTLSGVSARILSELVAFGGPVEWTTIAREIWPISGDTDAATDAETRALRTRWDVNLGRLRKKLEAAGIRGDLVRSDGCGNVELGLERHDVVRDEN